jgi:flagellar hook-length control protein FliK
MTVYSINKRAFEQANMTPATGSKAQTAADAFAAALQTSGSRYSVAATQPNAESAMKVSFDRPAQEARPAKAPEKAERPAPKEAGRPAPRKEAEASSRPEPTTSKPEAKADSADATDEQARADTGTEDNLTDSQPEEIVAVETETVEPIEAPVVAAAIQPAAQDIEIVEDGEEIAAATQVVVQDDDADLTRQTVTNNTADADDAAQSDADAAGQAEFAALAATAAKAGKAKAKTGPEEETIDQAALDQADQLAKMLAGTNARVAVKAQVQTNAATADAASSLDLLMAQDVGLTPEQLALAQTQPGNNGASGQGTNNAGQQVAANPALDNALAAQGKAVEAKPFIAALAAQIEASNQPQGPQGQQSGQAVAGLNGPAGTQAASKAQAPQAPHAPRQQQHLQQQVMDQVTVQIAKQAKDGVDTIKIQLKPVEMGAIEVKLDLAQDGRISGTVTADNKDTLAILQKDARGLEKALEDAGYKTEPGSLTFNLREGSQQSAQEGNAQGRGRGRRQGTPTGIDATASGAAQQAQSRSAGNRSGVDIQV